MTRNRSFWRKIIYISIMAVLLFPLYWISKPATSVDLDSGGVLAQMRTDHNLSQANLGEIDPAGEAIKLALLGMKGIAANILWDKALHYKKTHDWTNYSATLEQITKLQPNFIKVWQFQAWNLSYNVSVEFDNYLHRYQWVRKGMKFLIGGTRYNRDEPRLLWDIGWFIGQKLGRADEHRQFRREFRKDDDFHLVLDRYIPIDQALDPNGRPDNWLVGREWYLEAERAVTRGASLRGKSPILFYSSAPMGQINFAGALGDDGRFGDVYSQAWLKGHRQWTEYGNRDILTSYGYHIHLNELESIRDEVEELNLRLEQLAPGVKEQLVEEKRNDLTDEERKALDAPEGTLMSEQYTMRFEAQSKVSVTAIEIARRAPNEMQDRARTIANRIHERIDVANAINRYRDIVNFGYWRTRCEVEQRDDTNRAHQFVHDADHDLRAARLEPAKEKYESAWVLWAVILNEYPDLRKDVGAEDLTEAVKRYATCLDQLSDPFPKDFPLKELVEAQEPAWRPWEQSFEEAESE